MMYLTAPYPSRKQPSGLSRGHCLFVFQAMQM